MYISAKVQLCVLTEIGMEISHPKALCAMCDGIVGAVYEAGR